MEATRYDKNDVRGCANIFHYKPAHSENYTFPTICAPPPPPSGPGRKRAQGPSGPGPKFARAQVCPGPKWAQGPDLGLSP